MTLLSTEELRERFAVVGRAAALAALAAVEAKADAVAMQLSLFRGGSVVGPTDLSRAVDEFVYGVQDATELGVLYDFVPSEAAIEQIAQAEVVSQKFRSEISPWGVGRTAPNAPARTTLMQEVEDIPGRLARYFKSVLADKGAGETDAEQARATS